MQQPHYEKRGVIDSSGIALGLSSKAAVVRHDDNDERLTLWQAVKQYSRIVRYCVCLASAIVLYGYDLVIVGTVSALPQFQRNFGEVIQGKLIIGSLWLAVWGVASPFGALLGAGFGGWFQDRAGRRPSLVVGTILSIVAVALCYVCDVPSTFNGRRSFFAGAKALQGVAIGQLMVTTQTYMSEILPPKLRGPILAFFPISTLLGQLIGAIVLNNQISRPGSRAYKTCFASQWGFSAILLVVCFVIPESPTWLVRKHHLEKALHAQKRLNRPDMNSQLTLAKLQISIAAEEETTTSRSYIDCFKGVNLRRTLIICFANAMPMLFGLVLLSKASYFLQIIGMKPSDSTLFLIVGIAIGIVANIASIWTLNIYGRRPLIIYGMAVLSLLWVGMGAAGVYTGNFTIWYTSISMMIITFVAGLSCWPASYVVGSETSSLKLRALSSGIGWMTGTLCNAALTVVLPYIYNPDTGNLRGKTCFVFAATCLMACVVAWKYVPELKGRSPMEIDQMFAQRLPVKDFGKWRTEVDVLSADFEVDQREALDRNV